jgi:hypothetical protein
MPPKQPQHIEFDPDLPPGQAGRSRPALKSGPPSILFSDIYLLPMTRAEYRFAGTVHQNIKYMMSMLMQGEERDGVERLDT